MDGKSITKAAVSGAIAGAPGGPLGSVLGAMNATAVEVANQLVDSVRSADSALEAALFEEERNAVAFVLPELAKNLDELRASARHQSALLSDFHAVFRVWHEGWRSATEGKKRRILMAALVTAFDRHSYDRGMTATMMGLLNQLDYPAIRLLCHGFESHGPYRVGEPVDPFGALGWGENSLPIDLADQMVRLGLVRWKYAEWAKNMADGTKSLFRTRMGSELAHFIQDADRLVAAWDARVDE